MSDQYWLKVIKTMHNAEWPGFQKAPAGERLPDDHFVHLAAGVPPGQGEETIGYLRNAGLIEDRGDAYWLTEKGFDVAHERELVERQDHTNRFLAHLTALLVATATIQAFSAILALNGIERTAMIAFGLIILAFAVGYHWSQDPLGTWRR